MSVKIMGLVWDLSNEEIDREEKYILLAYADHADHKGYNIFPAIATISEKTGYKERAVQMITKSLFQKGYLVPDGKGPNGTNKWRVPLDDGGAKIAPAKIAGVQKEDDGGAKRKGKGGAIANAPESSLTVPPEPSVVNKPTTPQEIKIFREVRGRYPNSILYEDIVLSIQKISSRLTREVTKDDLLPFYKSWCSKGYNPNSLAWLEWAETGQIPVNGTWKSQKFQVDPNKKPELSADEIARKMAIAAQLVGGNNG